MVLVGKVDCLEIHVLAQILENRSYLLLNENGKGISLIDVSFDPKKSGKMPMFFTPMSIG
jgi:hypothetical protein